MAPRLHTALTERYKAFSTDQVLQMLRLYEQIKDWIVEFETDLVECVSIGGCGADIVLPQQISVDAWGQLWEDKQKALLDKLRLHFGFHVMLTLVLPYLGEFQKVLFDLYPNIWMETHCFRGTLEHFPLYGAPSHCKMLQVLLMLLHGSLQICRRHLSAYGAAPHVHFING
eukprot:jgi/Astpho2/5822/fgenesh1_pg.00080_%23_71_t